MRIAHISEKYAPAGGIEQYLIEMCALLQQHGHNNVIIYRQNHLRSAWDGSCPSYLVPRTGDRFFDKTEVETRVMRESPDVVFLHAVYDPELIRGISELLPTVAYIHGFYPVCPGLGKYYRRGVEVCTRPFGIRCVPLIYLRRCASARHPRSVYRIMRTTAAHQVAYRRLSQVVVASFYMKNLLVQNAFHACRISILPPHFVDTLPSVAQTDIVHNRVLYVGRLEVEKGFSYLLHAWAMLASSAELIVAGDGTLKDQYTALASKLGVADRVRFLGWQPRDQLAEVYRDCSMLVMPSVCPEAFGKAGVEAMAYGKPVIAFKVGGVPDWLKDRWNGFLVQPCNVRELAKRIEQLLNDHALATQLGANGKQFVEQNYALGQHLNKLLSIFESAENVKNG